MFNSQILSKVGIEGNILNLINAIYPGIRGFPGNSVVKNLPSSAEDAGDTVSMPGSGRSSQSTPILLPGKSYAQGSLVGYSL